MSDIVIHNPWRQLSTLTRARIALGRAGPAMPTREALKFQLAHARARDAVHMSFDADRVDDEMRRMDLSTLRATSAAPSREVYLRRPDLGRKLSRQTRTIFEGCSYGPYDLVIVVTDGLSAAAAHTHAPRLVEILLPQIREAGWSLGPIVIVHEGRVAIGDEIGELMRARTILLLVGERPGLSSPDSLGTYLTYAPCVGRTDADRNCVSNIRDEGLSYEHAAFKLSWLLTEAMRRSLTGVALKDEGDLLSVDTYPVLPSAE